MFRNRWANVIVFVSLILLPVGCNSSGDQALSGVVTYKGEPLGEGTIQFFQTGERPVVCAGATIHKGRYQIPKEHGLKPGTYLVRISSADIAESSKGGSFENPFPSGVRERIPSQYNTESKLTVEVGAKEQGELNFNLE